MSCPSGRVWKSLDIGDVLLADGKQESCEILKNTSESQVFTVRIIVDYWYDYSFGLHRIMISASLMTISISEWLDAISEWLYIYIRMTIYIYIRMTWWYIISIMCFQSPYGRSTLAGLGPQRCQEAKEKHEKALVLTKKAEENWIKIGNQAADIWLLGDVI